MLPVAIFNAMCLCASFCNGLKKVLLYCIPFFLFCSNSFAQISLFHNKTPLKIPSGSVLFYIDSSFDRSLVRYDAIRQGMADYNDESKTSLNYKNKMVWIRLNLDSIRNSDSLVYLMIRNPHLNYLKAWLFKNDTVLKDFPETGDRSHFSTRTIQHPDFVFPLPAQQKGNYSMLILAEKRNEMLTLPIHILNENGFLTYNRSKSLLTGLILGMSIFLFLFNLFLFVQMKERLYVFYGLYILMGVFYIFSDYGYSFMYLFPGNPSLPDFTRPIALSLATPFYLFFCIEFLFIKKQLPRFYRWMMAGLVCYLAIFLISIPFMSDTGKIRVVLQNLQQVLLTLLVLANLAMAVEAWRKKVPYASYIIITTIFLFLSITLFVLFLSGAIADTLLTRNLMNIGFMGEMSILAFVLSIRFKNYKEQSERLLRKSNLQQEQIFRTVTDYQEKELQRLSSLLHDSFGARLSALRFNLESEKNKLPEKEKTERVINEINILANDVRQFSHNFSPVLLQQRGLRDAICQFIKPINDSGRLYVQFEMMGSLERTLFRYELLIYNITQELLQNIIKHSKASEAIVQLILEDRLVSIYVEDNGKGFNADQIKDGLGFSQIKQLVTFVNGALRIDSSENKGARISIEFTGIPDETNPPDTRS